MRSAAWIGVVCLYTTVARADLLPDRPEPNAPPSTTQSVLIAGEVPPDRAVVVAGTLCGADVLFPGLPLTIIAMAPTLRLHLVSSAEAEQLVAWCGSREHDRVAELIARSPACGPAFAPVPRRSSSDEFAEVRWVFDVRVDAGTCASSGPRKLLLDAAGQPVTLDLLAPPPAPTTPPTPPPAPQAGGCGCRSEGPAGGWWLALVVGLVRRRRGRHRRVATCAAVDSGR